MADTLSKTALSLGPALPADTHEAEPVESPSSVDDVIVGYLDGLLGTGPEEIDWDGLLQQATSQAAAEPVQSEQWTVPEDYIEQPAPVPETECQLATEEKIVYQTSLAKGMELLPADGMGEAHPSRLPLQLLDSLFLVRRLPAGTRLHAAVLAACSSLKHRLDRVGYSK